MVRLRMPLKAWAGVLAMVVPSAPAAGWTHYACDAERRALADDGPHYLSNVRWVAGQDAFGEPIEFVGPSSPVVFAGRIFACARHYTGEDYTHNKIVAFDAGTGSFLWQTLLEPGAWDSWSSPCVDVRHGAVLIGSGAVLYSLDAATGQINWQRSLEKVVVNASACVTDDLDANRAFITDYDGFGTTGLLYCVNVDPYAEGLNPYQPGQIVWQDVLGGTSGNTPAYHDGVVYVASVCGREGDGVGHVYAFDARSGEEIWDTAVGGAGFFGGVTYAEGFVYAASYAFYGQQDNAELVKLDASTGQIVWTVPAERTDSIPLVIGDVIYLAAGIQGFGSVVKIEAFQDNGTSAVKLWDTYQDTAGSLLVGGWSHQPAYAAGRLYAGTLPLDGAYSFGPYTDLYVLDVSRAPGEPGFVLAHYEGAGSSPAISEGVLYTIGQAGLHAFRDRVGDLDLDGDVDLDDYGTFQACFSGPGGGSAGGCSSADLDGDGDVDLIDFATLQCAVTGSAP